MKHFRHLLSVLIFAPLCLCLQFGFNSRQALTASLPKHQIAKLRSWVRHIPLELRFSDTDEVEDSSAAEETETTSEQEIDGGSDTTQLPSQSESDEKASETVPEDPKLIAIKDLEIKLRDELSSAESLLRAERIQLSKSKESAFERGKNGYFMVQAQVNDFVRRKDAEQKTKINKNKREVVTKLIPILDAFREVPEKFPATTDREKKMHDDFNVLLRSILIALQKYGYSEYSAEVGDEFRSDKHEVVGLVDGDSDVSTIVQVIRQGVLDSEGLVLRKAQVIASNASKSEESKEKSHEELIDGSDEKSIEGTESHQ